MTLPTLQPEVIATLRSAGATEEMIASAVKASGEFPTPQRSRTGRPREHASDTARKRAWKKVVTKGGSTLASGSKWPRLASSRRRQRPWMGA
jgi:hypothetical protein